LIVFNTPFPSGKEKGMANLYGHVNEDYDIKNEFIKKGLAEVGIGEKNRQKSWFIGPKYGKAATAFEKAAKYFQLAHDYDQAEKYFRLAAEMRLKGKELYKTAVLYYQAGVEARKLGRTDRFLENFQACVENYILNAQFVFAGKVQKEIGDFYEGEEDWANALQAYQKAVDIFNEDGSYYLICLEKTANLAAKLTDYALAAQRLEDLIVKSLASSLIPRQKLYDFYLQAGLYVFLDLGATRLPEIRKKLDQLKSLCPSFKETEEAKVLDEIYQAFYLFEEAVYQEVVEKYATKTYFAPNKIGLFLQVKDLFL